MDNITIIPFTDLDSKSDAIAIVRVVQGKIGLTLSIRIDGDTEVFMEPESAVEVARALNKALTDLGYPLT